VPDLPSASRRVLEAAARKGVTIEIVEFPESTHTAVEAAAAIGAEVAQIVKSLVFVAPEPTGGLSPILVLTSGVNRVDIGRLAAVLGTSNLRRASADEARALTGFVIGGIPPFGHPEPVRTVMDPDLGRFPVVWAAAGTPNAVFSVPPKTLASLTNAVVAPIAVEAPPRVAVGPGTEARSGRPTDGRSLDDQATDGRSLDDQTTDGQAAAEHAGTEVGRSDSRPAGAASGA
jgi:prolyl-tRNA editing enzyme YbaK/EbsC (Cys-tRNA(Pro) deacylase)